MLDWMRYLLEELGYDVSRPSPLLVDNKSAIQVMSTSPTTTASPAPGPTVTSQSDDVPRSYVAYNPAPM